MTKPDLLTNKPNAWEMEFFWEKHKQRILIGAIVLAMVGLGTAAFFIRDNWIGSASRALLMSASTHEQLQAVISKYPSSDAAASALLLLAAEQRSNGQLEASDAAYQNFLKKFPKHSLAGGAALGLAENALIGGRLEEGISQLQTLAIKYPTSFAAPYALYRGGDLLAFQPGQAAEAKKQLRNLSQQFPDSFSTQYAANLLVLLGSRPDLNGEKNGPTVPPIKR